MIARLIWLLLAYLVALGGACTVDSDVTSAGCPTGVNVGDPTQDPPVIAGQRDPGDSSPLDARDPCAPVVLAPEGKKAQCRVYWPGRDGFTFWYSRSDNKPKNLTHAQVMCRDEMRRQGADNCNTCDWVDDDGDRPTDPAGADWWKCWAYYPSGSKLWYGQPRPSTSDAAKKQCILETKRQGGSTCDYCVKMDPGETPEEPVECTVRKAVDGGLETMDTWHSTDDNLTEAETECDSYYGWPESGTKCSGCRWVNGPGAAMVYYCSGNIACTDSVRPPPNVAGCTFDNRRIEGNGESEARHRAVFECLQMVIAKYGRGQWGCASSDLTCVTGGNAPNSESVVQPLGWNHAPTRGDFQCTTSGTCELTPGTPTAISHTDIHVDVSPWRAVSDNEAGFDAECVVTRGGHYPLVDGTTCLPFSP